MTAPREGPLDGASAETNRARALGTFTLFLSVPWLALFAYGVHAGMPYNPVRLPFEKVLSTKTWLPEGWAFFTRDPREEDARVFVRSDDGHWASASKGPHSRPSNLFGLDRHSRAQGIEMGLLLGGLPGNAWQPCGRQAAECLEGAPLAATLINVSPRATLCGVLGVVLQKPVPWAWSRARQRITMPSRVARLEVKC